MKKSNIDIQNENAILLAIAIADGYFPVNEKEYDKEFKRRIRTCGISDYKEAFNFVRGNMPEHVGDNAIFSGIMSLVNDNNDEIRLYIGNNEQVIDDYTNIPKKIVEDFACKYNIKIDSAHVLKDKYTMYAYLKDYVLPEMLKQRQEIKKSKGKAHNTLQEITDRKIVDTIFDYKFSAFAHREKARGNNDFKYYSLAHGMFDANCDLFHSLVTAIDNQDIDCRAISPYPDQELGIDIVE